MALTDEQMQSLQKVTKINAGKNEGDIIEIGGENLQEYEVVASMDEVTQAISVAPIINGEPDYDQTAIVVAGTQPPGDENGNGLLNEGKSFYRAGKQAAFGYSDQGADVERLYRKTQENLEARGGGTITNMSGHSQSGVAVAKVAARHHVDKVTNFSDWGAGKAYKNGYITKADKDYLDRHAHIYSDSENKTTKFDTTDGDIPYGIVREVEGSDHTTQFAKIKGNNLDIDYYVKKDQFCSGMTQAQVEKVAKAKAEAKAKKEVDKYLKEHPDADADTMRKEKEEKYYRKYIKDYDKIYEPKADSKKSSKNAKVKQTSFAFTKDKTYSLAELDRFVGKYKAQLLGGMGSSSQQILVKADLLIALAHQAVAHFALYEAKALTDLEDIKEQTRRDCQEAINLCYQAAQTLPSGEVEALIDPIRFENVWDEGAEADFKAQLQAYKGQMEEISASFISASHDFTAIDNAGAAMFSLV